jgi:hypothetical protein
MRRPGCLGKRGTAERAGDVGRDPSTSGAVQGNSPTGCVFGTGAFGESVYREGTTGGTNQRFLVPVCRDQDERLGRSVLLDAPTSHSRPF